MVFHCDAVQAFGKAPANVERDHIDLLSLAPISCMARNVWCLVRPAPQSPGFADSANSPWRTRAGFLSGTLNVPGIVGFGAACALCARALTFFGPSTDRAHASQYRGDDWLVKLGWAGPKHLHVQRRPCGELTARGSRAGRTLHVQTVAAGRPAMGIPTAISYAGPVSNSGSARESERAPIFTRLSEE